jgi:hypothetical protein
MATNYPGSLDTSSEQPSPLASTEMDDAGFEHDVVHTNHSGAIIALETKVGTGSSTAVADSVLAGTGAGTSSWSTSPSLAGLTVDTDTLYVDATNDRVGINTSSPGYSLTVGTPSGNASTQIMAASGSYPQLFFGDGGTNQWHIESTPGGGALYFVETGVGYPLTLLPGNKVGIGDTTPSYNLDVNGTGRFTSHLTLDGDLMGTSNTNFYVKNDSGEEILFQESSNSLFFKTNGTWRAYFTSGGDFIPYTGSSFDLGSSGNRWSQVWADTFYVGGGDDGLRTVTGSYGNVQTTGEGANGWEGYSINGWVVFMANSSTGNYGIYDDVNNKWSLYCDFAGTTDIRYNGAAKATTRNGGLEISGDVYVTGLDVVFGNTSSNDYIRYSDSAYGAMGGRFSFIADGSSANSQIVGGTAIFSRDVATSTADDYQDSTSDYNTITAVGASANSGNTFTDATIVAWDTSSTPYVGFSAHADYQNYAPVIRSTTSGGTGWACRNWGDSTFVRILASAFQVNSTEDSKQEIVDAPPLLQRFRDYVAEGHHTKQFRRKEYAEQEPAYLAQYPLIERDHGKEEADAWLEKRHLQNVWTRTDADWLELDKMQNGVEFTEFGVVIDEFGPAFPEVAAWEANEDGTEMVPVGLDLSSAIGFLMRLVEDLDEENNALEARVAALEAA